MQVSVVATVFNEGPSIDRLLTSLAAQTRRPDEVIICDGGSIDDTVQRIEAFAQTQDGALPGLRVIIEPGANISRGRNVAIAAARGPIIAVTDAGVRLTSTWLGELVRPFEVYSDTRAVAGFFAPDIPQGDNVAFAAAMGATVLPQREDIDPVKFLPSSRSIAFTKETWQQAGGYPEWLDYCEDLIFDFNVNALTPDQPTAFTWAPDALVYFRPRESLDTFWAQYYRYARGDGKADLWRKRHVLRYFVYLVLFPALLGHGLWGFFARWLGWVGLIAGVIAYCWRPWQRLGDVGRGMPRIKLLAAAGWVPIIRAVGDIAKMVGYPVGLRWRRRHRQRAELDWRKEGELARAAADRRT